MSFPAVDRVNSAWGGDGFFLIALASIVTLLNAFKPLTCDDATYLLFAEQIARHPFDPYGTLLWDALPANNQLAPPVFLYWWAGVIRLFGSDPFVWKLSLLPINLLLVVSLHSISRRFTAIFRRLFVAFVMFSGAVLPLVNLMLDIPANALSLAATSLFFRACDRSSLRGAVAAGFVAGLAMETKYTAFVTPAVLLFYSVHAKKSRLGMAAAATAAALFILWECLVAAKYGASHFLLAASARKARFIDKVHLVMPLFGCLGGMFAFALPLSLAALGRSWRVVAAAASALPLFLAVLAWPLVPVPGLGNGDAGIHPNQTFVAILFGIFGFAIAASIAAVAMRLLFRRDRADAQKLSERPWWTDRFLVGWLLLELLGYFALTPFPACRRLIGVCVVSSLLICRLASSAPRPRTRLLCSLAGANAAYGLLLFTLDFLVVHGQETLIAQGVVRCREQRPTARVWLFTQRGCPEQHLEYYAGRLGVHPLPTPQTPAAGDFILVLDQFHEKFSGSAAVDHCVAAGSEMWRSPVRLKSRLMAGNSPLAHWTDPRIRLTCYLVR